MHVKVGEPVRGVLHSTDASSGVEIPIYDRGNTTTTRTLLPTERLHIHHVKLITAVGGDSRVFVGADSTPANGEDVVRGTFTAGGGLSDDVFFSGEKGDKPYAIAPAGVVDVFFEGAIVQVDTDGERPDWQASLVPGS